MADFLSEIAYAGFRTTGEGTPPTGTTEYLSPNVFATFRTLAAPALGEPRDLRAVTIRALSVDITWRGPVGGVNLTTDVYDIFVDGATSPTHTVTPTTTSGFETFTITGLTANTDHSLEIQLRRTVGSTVTRSARESLAFMTIEDAMLVLTVAATAACMLGLNSRLDETFTIPIGTGTNIMVTPRQVIEAAFGSGENQIPLP